MKKIFYLLIFIPCFALGQDPVVIAHRGGSGMAPENTLAAFNYAAGVQADFFELDVMISSDDSLVIMHDASVDRTTDGTGNVSSLTYAQLRELDAGSWFGPEFAGEKIPTLYEALMVAKNDPGNIGVVIEIKSTAASVPARVLELVQKLGMQSRVIVSSFNLAQITEVKTLDPTIPVQLFGTITQSNIDQVSAINGEWVGTGGTIDQSLLDYAHGLGIKMNAWTLNAASTMLPMIALGIDGITTDYPELLQALMDDTPPSDVVLTSAIPSETRITLAWEAAVDNESGIAGYEIFRDEAPDATTLLVTVGDVTEFIDETYMESHQYYYRIKAKNLAGLSSANYSNELGVSTLNDITPPLLEYISSRGDSTTVVVGFTERVDRVTAETQANYTLNHGAIVNSVRMAKDMQSVILTTTPLAEPSYTLTVKNIKDLALTPNTIVTVSKVFLHEGLQESTVAFYRLDSVYTQDVNEVILDETVNENTGILMNGVSAVEGILGNALDFDGVDDFVQFSSSPSFDINAEAVSVSLWTKLAYKPTELPVAYGPLFDSETDNYVLYEDRGNSELRFKVSTSSSAERPGIPDSDIPTGEWIHVVGVYDGAHAMIYLNGELKDSHAITGTVKPGQVATLGKTGTVYFTGSIDQVEVYKRALSGEEIMAMYQGIRMSPMGFEPGNVVLNEAEVNGTDVKLTWAEASNYESSIMGYEIYRGKTAEPEELYVTVEKTTEFTDMSVDENSDYFYRIKAKNTRGIKSPEYSNEIKASTTTDAIRPEVVFATSRGERSEIFLEYSEKVEASSAVNLSNYTLDQSVSVTGAILEMDGKTVKLSTSGLTEQTYILTINNVTDLAAVPNQILPDTKLKVTHTSSPQGLIAWYTMEELLAGDPDTLLIDETSNANNGTLENKPVQGSGLLGEALVFDNQQQQYVQFANSTSFDINDTMVSISAWVKLTYLPVEMPEAYGPVFDSQGDEYVIYADRGNKELRFKVTTSAKAERPGIPNDDLVTGQWINIFAVYDGSNAMIYLNGELKDSHPITGTVKAGTVPMLGKSGTTGTPAFLSGSIDNIEVFNIAFTQQEIMEKYLGYRAMAVFDCTSYQLEENISICAGESYIFPDGSPGSVTMDHDSYLKTLYGCDSIITTHLTVTEVETGVTQSGNTLTADLPGAIYKWLDCSLEFAEISGETGRDFSVFQTGEFAVEITFDGCVDTSQCYYVDLTDVEFNSDPEVKIYPNPNTGIFTMEIVGHLGKDVMIEVINHAGKIVYENRYGTEGNYIMDLSFAEAGIYVIRVTFEKENIIKRLIIQ